MDARMHVVAVPQRYRCPGEEHDIDRALHLGRLADYYPACRGCEFRHDRQLLAPRVAGHWDELENCAGRGVYFTSEALESDSLDAFSPQVASRLATSLATVLW